MHAHRAVPRNAETQPFGRREPAAAAASALGPAEGMAAFGAGTDPASAAAAGVAVASERCGALVEQVLRPS